MRNFIVLIVAYFIFYFTAYAQISGFLKGVWHTQFSSMLNANAQYSVEIDNDSNYIIGGSNILLKFDSSGNLKWNKTYNENNSPLSILEVMTIDSSYILLHADGLFKTTKHGNIIWSNKKVNTFYYEEVFSDLERTKDNGFVVIGTSKNENIILTRFDSAGNTVWSKTLLFNNMKSNGFYVKQMPDSGFIIGGALKSTNYYYSTFLFSKVNENGNIEWAKKVNIDANIVDFNSASMLVDSNKYIFLVNYYKDGYPYTLFLNADSSFFIVQSKRINNGSDNPFKRSLTIQKTPDGNYAFSASTIFRVAFGNLLYKIDEVGNVLSSVYVGMWPLTGFKILPNGNYLISGAAGGYYKGSQIGLGKTNLKNDYGYNYKCLDTSYLESSNIIPVTITNATYLVDSFPVSVFSTLTIDSLILNEEFDCLSISVKEFDNINDNQFSVFPNPSKGIFEVVCLSSNSIIEDYDLEVFNLLGGKLSCIKKKYADNILIDVSGYPEGLYVLRIVPKNSSEAIFYKKLLLIK